MKRSEDGSAEPIEEESSSEYNAPNNSNQLEQDKRSSDSIKTSVDADDFDKDLNINKNNNENREINYNSNVVLSKDDVENIKNNLTNGNVVQLSGYEYSMNINENNDNDNQTVKNQTSNAIVKDYDVPTNNQYSNRQINSKMQMESGDKEKSKILTKDLTTNIIKYGQTPPFNFSPVERYQNDGNQINNDFNNYDDLDTSLSEKFNEIIG